MNECHLGLLIIAVIAAQAFGGGSFLRRPLITGCLSGCSAEDQACVTSCQVCVEQHNCRDLEESRCRVCAQPIIDARRKLNNTLHGIHDLAAKTSKQADPDGEFVHDSGGVPLIRDGVRMLLARAQGDELYTRRHLRSARAEVLQAQRQAEWAAHQRRDEATDLHEARDALKAARRDLAKWKLKTVRKVKELKAAERENALKAKKRQKELKAKEKKKMEKKEQEEKEREESNEKGEKNEEGEKNDKGETNEKREKKTERKEPADESHASSRENKALQRIRREENDAEWIEGGLQKEVAKEREDVKDAIADHRISRLAERESQRLLKDGKRQFLRLASTYSWSERRVRRLARKLRRLSEKLRPDSHATKGVGVAA